MSLTIKLNGAEYGWFTEAQVQRGMEIVASSFSFSATSFNDKFIPIHEGDLVEIFADGDFLILTGFVDSYSVEYDDKTHAIQVKGRSLTADVVDGTVGEVKDFESTTFLNLCESVTEGIKSGSGMKVINNAGILTLIQDYANAETGQNMFDFLQKYARQQQVLLTDDKDGNLIIVRSSTKLSKLNLKNKIDANNNIKKARRTVNIANLYNKYIAQAELSPINAKSNVVPEDLADQIGIAFDDEIRSSRIYEFYAEATTDSKTLEDRAKWEMSIRRARGLHYQCTVKGHSFDDVLWKDNNLYQVDDDFAGLYGQFLCNKIIYKYSIPKGNETELFLTNKNAYSLESNKDELILSAGGGGLGGFV